MKNTMKLEALGLVELNHFETLEIGGGEKHSFWWWLGTIAAIVGGIAGIIAVAEGN
jgi:hypothetical protein